MFGPESTDATQSFFPSNKTSISCSTQWSQKQLRNLVPGKLKDEKSKINVGARFKVQRETKKHIISELLSCVLFPRFSKTKMHARTVYTPLLFIIIKMCLWLIRRSYSGSLQCAFNVLTNSNCSLQTLKCGTFKRSEDLTSISMYTFLGQDICLLLGRRSKMP